MKSDQRSSPGDDSALRLWPGVALAVVVLAARFVVPLVSLDAVPLSLLGALVGSVGIILWWAFFSRATLTERLAGVAAMALLPLAIRPLLHPSTATAGMGYFFPILSVPLACVALVAWAVVATRSRGRRRLATLLATLLLAYGGWMLVRTGGISNQGQADWAFRWTRTPEERLLAGSDGEAMAGSVPMSDVESRAEWPGFRGPRRDGIAEAVRIGTDWESSPPVEVWRRPIGPGWSSFAVRGDLLLTQEQRGDREAVSAYRVSTGEPVWRHEDATRFWEANAGAGPRATPTLSGEGVFTFGATGVLNALDVRDGSVLWARDVAADTGIEAPMWGFSSSPLVVGDIVAVAAVGKLAAYDTDTGEPRWYGPDGGDGYSSPQRLSIDGVEQVLLMSLDGAVSIDPRDGTILWRYEWPGHTRIVQPALVDGSNDLLLSSGVTTGMRRVGVSRRGGEWTVEERWSSTGLKPYFSDFVVHEGHAYGFDGNILSAIDIETGDRDWKGGRYGSGQMILLPAQDLLLVVSETGEVALVGAVPQGFKELARFEAIEGKTWNHPVVVGNLLLVRNGEEMAAFRLPSGPA